MIIDGRTYHGTRTSVSIDDDLWKLLVAAMGSEDLAEEFTKNELTDEEAARWKVRNLIKQSEFENSRTVRRAILELIVSPAVWELAFGEEAPEKSD